MKDLVSFTAGIGILDFIMILPTYALIYDPAEKSIEFGLFFLKYCLTLKIKK